MFVRYGGTGEASRNRQSPWFPFIIPHPRPSIIHERNATHNSLWIVQLNNIIRHTMSELKNISKVCIYLHLSNQVGLNLDLL